MADGRPSATPQSSLHSARYLPQLMAAIGRHHEAQTWGSWMTVMVAEQAIRGDREAQRILLEEPGWQLNADGSFAQVDHFAVVAAAVRSLARGKNVLNPGTPFVPEEQESIALAALTELRKQVGL